MNTTPAPWHVESPSYNGRLFVIGRGDRHVCTVEAHFEADKQYNEANAKLISYAPEMMRLLLSAVEHVESCNDGMERWLKEARIVISSANVRPLAPADNQTPNENGQS
jgi:hypothetical protein